MIKSSKFKLILTIIAFVIISYIAYLYFFKPTHKVLSLKIGIPEAKGRRFGLIIDVRTPKERQQLGFYPNSIPISISTLQTQVPLDISNKNTWILIYSNADNRAQIAANRLYKMGYRNVRYINESYLSLMPGSS
jgi:rhodanese-related sulfurtransferase